MGKCPDGSRGLRQFVEQHGIVAPTAEKAIAANSFAMLRPRLSAYLRPEDSPTGRHMFGGDCLPARIFAVGERTGIIALTELTELDSRQERTAVTEPKQKRIAIGDAHAVIRSDSFPVQYVDVITEIRQSHGIVTLSMGSLILDADNEPEIQVGARLRMSILTARALNQYLERLLKDEFKPSEPIKVN